MMRAYLYVICLFACTPAAAEIYKCTDPQGAVHYTDKPCAGESAVFMPRAAPNADADSARTRPGVCCGPTARNRQRQSKRPPGSNSNSNSVKWNAPMRATGWTGSCAQIACTG